MIARLTVLASLTAVALIALPESPEADSATNGADSPAAVADGSGDVHHAPLDEIARIRSHLVRVGGILREADISHLTVTQRRARAQNIDRLERYAATGVFPHNHVVPGERVPVFVDEHGTHCAVGYLIAMSGEWDLVERVRSTNNLVRVPKLAGDPELEAWLEKSGLTLEEAALIQPTYGHIPGPSSTTGAQRAYEAGTIAASAFSGASMAWSLLAADDGDARRTAGKVGVGIGFGQIALGALGIAVDDDEFGDTQIGDRFLTANFAVGALTAALGLRLLLGGEEDGETGLGNATGRGAGTDAARFELAPYVADGGEAAGVRLSVRF
ncbi:MAG: hypothetical protein ABFS34_14785 [Gemmatimonadota bacterium]